MHQHLHGEPDECYPILIQTSLEITQSAVL